MIKEIHEELKPLTKQLLNHPLYQKINTPEQLQIFMEHHVFAVWDFMSLLTALQEILTKTTNPWLPVGDPEVRYLINEIVLAEETDINMHGKRQSHFEMYIDAMKKAGANPEKMESLLTQVHHGTDIFLLIAANNIPISVKQFLKHTFEVVYSREPHRIASAFTFGREGLIPEMFTSIIQNIQKNFPEEDLTEFKYYFDRHIELDGDEHGPMAFKMVENLCGNSDRKWEEAKTTAVRSLESRIELWNGIEAEIESKTKVSV